MGRRSRFIFAIVIVMLVVGFCIGTTTDASPTPVLLDRDGRVVAVDDKARGENLSEVVGELVEAGGGGS